MINRLSLRVKITLISTIIMILVAVVLTSFSVVNANLGFSTVMLDISSKSDTSNVTYGSKADEAMEDNIESIPYTNSFISSVISRPINDTIESNMISSELAETTLAAADNFAITALCYMIAIIIIGSILIYLILGRVLEPVKKLSYEVGVINENKLSRRIVGFKQNDEIGELAEAFNNMLDRLDKAFESQKRFSSDAAHELKTPLTALRTNLDILEMDENPSDDDYRRIVSIFKKQTERMINLVNNLFILSAQKEYDFDDIVAIDRMINDILLDLENEIRKKNIRVEFNESKVQIQGNKTMITHAVNNIIQNAVKYNNEYGSIAIDIEEDKKDCIIKVRDTGIGIEEDKVEHIFDAFYRIDKSRSRKIAGAGLGLAITKDIINSHGGDIRYFPNEEGGSIFEITLPHLINS